MAKSGRGYRTRERPLTASWWRRKLGPPFEEMVWHYLVKLNTALPAIPFLGIWTLEELRTGSAALRLEQSECPSVEQCRHMR